MYCSKDLTCVHKDLFPLLWEEYMGSVLLFIVIGLAAASGIGGGSLIMPIALVCFGWEANDAVPLSNFCIFASSLLLFIKNINVPHPQVKERISIDYESVLILYPMVLMGASIGVIFSIVLPSLAIIAGLTGVLIFLLVKSLKKCMKLRKSEKEKNHHPWKEDQK
jgi:uncharacterized membrane protein YfcA